MRPAHDRDPAASSSAARPSGRAQDVLLVALRLGLTSFGGPIAHLGYFHEEYVRRRGWVDARQYADIVALSQFLPGPASSQVGIAIGTLRAGRLGGLLAWIGFTAPSAVVMFVAAVAIAATDVADAGWVRGLTLVAVAVVLQAVVGMARTLAPDPSRRLIAVAAAAVLVLWGSAIAQVAVLAAGAVVGLVLLRSRVAAEAPVELRVPIGGGSAAASLALFVVLLIGLPVAAAATGERAVSVADRLYSAGSLVFGGGHVVLPLLAERVVDPGWVDAERFLAGYGAAQALPGPLLAFALYLGAILDVPPNGPAGGLLALGAIFLPSFLLIWGVLPFWWRLRRIPGVGPALAGTNAAVVGLLAAALYDPIGVSAVRSPADAAVAASAFALLAFVRVPPWLVVLTGALGGVGLDMLGVR